MIDARYLIVNADDFGLARAVNKGILAAHTRGIVTSASLMVRAAHAAHAVELARAHPHLSIGLHLDLGEWEYHAPAWITRYQVVPLDDAKMLAAAVSHQLDMFRKLLGRNPTHLDSHQHVHLNEPLKSIAQKFARELHIPLRGCDERFFYCGAFYGQDGKGQAFPEGITFDALAKIIRALPRGITELGCHPAVENNLQSVYARERVQELRALTDPRLLPLLRAERIVRRSFAIQSALTGFTF